MPQARITFGSGLLHAHYPLAFASGHQADQAASTEPRNPTLNDPVLSVSNVYLSGLLTVIEVAEYYKRPDKSPIVIRDIYGSDLTLHFRQPLQLNPFMDESEELICAENPDLGINAFARTRAGLIHEINSQILMLWYEFAQESDEHLSEPAIELKHSLQSSLEVTERA